MRLTREAPVRDNGLDLVADRGVEFGVGARDALAAHGQFERLGQRFARLVEPKQSVVL